MSNITLPRAVGERLREAHKCFEAAQFEGWEAAIQSGDIDRIRDLWQRRMSHGVAAIEAALAEPPAKPEPATDATDNRRVWDAYIETCRDFERFHGIKKEDK